MNGNNRIADYIKEVCDQIKNKEVHPAITLELENHFAEKIEDYREAGYGEDEATRIAIAEMGDPVDVGRHLHQAHKPRMEWGILAIVGILLGVGLLVLYSLQIAQNEQNWLERQLNGILIGTVALVAILFSDYNRLKRYSRLLYFVTLLLLLFTLSFGDPVHNIPHLDIRVEVLNVFYISPFLLIVAIAGIFTEWKENGRFTIMKAIALFLPPCFLLLSVRQDYSIIMFLIGYVTLLIASQANWRAVLSFLGMSFSIIIGKYYLFATPQELDRFFYFLNPYSDPTGKGYQTIQSMETIQSAGMWGHGFGSTMDTLPALESNYIFVYLVHSLGLVAGASIFILGIVLLVRLLLTIKQVKDSYGAMLLSGITTLFFTPFFWSIFMTMGLVPYANVYLPLVSYGYGITQLVLQMALIGLVLNVYRRKDIQPLTKAS
ncbi:FtsW/RodA/SpoVE family cell cycle protein [Brevibacillus fortis]|uniref:FtsW/RodA/SpoVE family cell cycle protein n=1 Tax=Brevibacillus fortis TaxID=2126352 RepID=UPI002E1AE84C|nr:FtsW/RodA/SpoVE family cell cycle protein [Brevibacillus fortis]